MSDTHINPEQTNEISQPDNRRLKSFSFSVEITSYVTVKCDSIWLLPKGKKRSDNTHKVLQWFALTNHCVSIALKYLKTFLLQEHFVASTHAVKRLKLRRTINFLEGAEEDFCPFLEIGKIYFQNIHTGTSLLSPHFFDTFMYMCGQS